MRTVHIQFVLHAGNSIYLLQICIRSWVNSYKSTGKENLIKPKYAINS